LGLKICSEGQRIPQLKSKTYNTTLIKSIGNPTGIERPTNIDNAFGNKEADHLFYRDSKEVDHLFQIVRVQYIIKKEAREVVSKENPYIPKV
jgi:hypothetical protein